MLAFHCTAVSTLLSPAVTAGCGCPGANPSVLPGDQCPQQQPGGKDCITHGLLLPGPTVRGFQTGAAVIGQRHLHRSSGSHRPQVCKHWKSVPGLSKVKSSPLPGLQKCSESKLFIFSSCGACDQRPPAKKSWFVGCECWGMWDHLLQHSLSQQEWRAPGRPRVSHRAVTLHKPSEDSTGGRSQRPPACTGAGVMMQSSSQPHPQSGAEKRRGS